MNTENETDDPGMRRRALRPAAGPELEPILRTLEYPGDAPQREALEAAIARRDEITPFLLDILRNDAATLAEDDEYAGHVFAMYLLAQFREPRAYPLIVELFS